MNSGHIIEAKPVNVVGSRGERFAWALWIMGPEGEEVGVHAAPLTPGLGAMFRPRAGMACSWTSAHVYVQGGPEATGGKLAFHLIGQPFTPHGEGYDQRDGKHNVVRRG